LEPLPLITKQEKRAKLKKSTSIIHKKPQIQISTKENISPKAARNIRNKSVSKERASSQKSLINPTNITNIINTSRQIPVQISNTNLEHKKGLLRKITNPSTTKARYANITNNENRNTIGETKENLALPDDNNFNKIVSFVQDLKIAIAPEPKIIPLTERQPELLNEIPNTCRNVEKKLVGIIMNSEVKRQVRIKKITFSDKSRMNISNVNNSGYICPMALTTRQKDKNNKTLINCWTNEDEEKNFENLDFNQIRKKMNIQKGENLALFTKLKTHTRPMKLKISLKEPFYISDNLNIESY